MQNISDIDSILNAVNEINLKKKNETLMLIQRKILFLTSTRIYQFHQILTYLFKKLKTIKKK